MEFISIALRALPWAGPGVLLTLALATGWALWRGRTQGFGLATQEALLIAWIGCYVSITLTPGALIVFDQSRSACGLSLARPLGLGAFHNIGDRALNLLICLPAGFLAVTTPRHRTGWIIAVVATPIAAEIIQYLAPFLGRACQLADLQDNWEGALVGALLAGLLVLLRRLIRTARS